MKKIKALFLVISLLTITGINDSYAISICNATKNPGRFEVGKYFRVDEFVKLSAKQFSELTGKKMNWGDKIRFGFMKLKMKQDLKKNPNLTLHDYSGSNPKHHLATGWWILIGIAGLLLLSFLIFIIAYGSSE